MNSLTLLNFPLRPNKNLRSQILSRNSTEMKSKFTRILIAESHSLFLESLRQLIHETKHIQINAIVNTPEAALIHLNQQKEQEIDLAIINIELFDQDALKTLNLIRKKFTSVHLLAMSMNSHPTFLLQLMKSEVSGFIMKSKVVDQLLTAIQQIIAGNSYFPKEFLSAITKYQQENRMPLRISPRELKILSLLIAGKTKETISAELDISPKTMRLYIRNLMNKLEAPNEEVMVKYANERGLLDD